MKPDVVAVVDDLFFASKIRGAAEQLNLSIQFAKSIDEILKVQSPNLIVVDLHSQRIDPLVLANQLKSTTGFAGTRLIGFCSHVQTELQESARNAGYDQVLPRSVFSRDLNRILSEAQATGAGETTS